MNDVIMSLIKLGISVEFDPVLYLGEAWAICSVRNHNGRLLGQGTAATPITAFGDALHRTEHYKLRELLS